MPLTVRERIVYTLSSFEVEITDEFVDQIEQEVLLKNPKSPLGLAYTIARNKAIDLIQKKAAERRRKAKQMLKKEKKKRLQAEFETAQAEFWPTAQKALESVKPITIPKAQEYLILLWIRVFGKNTEIQSKNNNPAQRKGVERGRKLIKKYASPQLWKVISVKHKNKNG